jgi:putative FmdB family regulatory protein
MRYDYVCGKCSHEIFDFYQSIKDDPITKCPACDQNSLKRVISGGAGAFVQNTNTIGSLADRNARKNSSKINEIEAKKAESKPTEEKPWYHKSGGANGLEISKMTKEQKANYIMRGKK